MTDTSLPFGDKETVVLKLPFHHVTLSQLKYITFVMMGIALLWPWNCFLSASEYFRERFSDSPKLADNYSSTMMSISTISSTAYNFYLSQKQHGANYEMRVYWGQLITVFIFLMMGLSCVIGTNISSGIFFVFVMTNVLLSSLATCLAQNGTMAIVNVMGAIYANGVMVGQAVAGIFPSIALILSILAVDTKGDAVSIQQEKNAGLMVYFITACLMSAVTLGLFSLCKHWEKSKYVSLDEEEEQTKHIPFVELWHKLKAIVVTIFLTFAITLAFPVFASTVESVHSDTWYSSRQIYIPIAFLLWNLGDFIGRLICAWERFVVSSPVKLVLFSLLRLLFVPLFFMCNIKGRGGFIGSDFVYLFLQFFFGLTNGQLCSSCFMNVGSFLDTEHEKKAAGGFTTVFLSLGLAAGSLCSYSLVALIG